MNPHVSLFGLHQLQIIFLWVGVGGGGWRPGGGGPWEQVSLQTTTKLSGGPWEQVSLQTTTKLSDSDVICEPLCQEEE